MTPAQEEAMRRMRGELADKLVQIEDIATRYGVPMHSVTLVMRDPAKSKMFTVLSTEQGEENFRAAAELITTQAGIPVPRNTAMPLPTWPAARRGC